MARPARPLEIAGGTTAFLVLSLSVWFATRGPADAHATEIARSYEVVPENDMAPIDAADLAAPNAAESVERMEIVDEVTAAALAEEEARAALPRCEVEGVMLMPRTFPSNAAATVKAWPIEVEEHAAPVELTFGTNEMWRFDRLLPGRWVFIARAESGDRVAWGRSEEMDLRAAVRPDLVRIALEEYVVQGVVTDSAGMPIIGLPIAYSWDGLDPYSGEEVETVSFGQGEFRSSGRYTISFTEANVEIASEPVNVQTVRSIQVQTFEGSPSLSEELSKSLASSWIDAAAFESIEGLEFDVSPSFQLHNSASDSVRTDASGRFRIACRGPGRVSLTVPQAGRELAPGETRWLEQRRSVETTTEAPVATADFVLMRAATVSGRMLRSDGEGTDDISVFLRRHDARSTETSSTNANGEFRFDECRPGVHRFYARGGGGSGQAFSLHLEFELKEGEDLYLDDILTPSSSMTGVVIDGTGAPVAGVAITAFGARNDNLKRTGRTDAAGRFTIVGMYGCEYRLVVLNHEIVGPANVVVAANGDRVDVGTVQVEGPAGR